MKIKTIQISAHARDCFSMTLISKEGRLFDYEGYVPDIINGGNNGTKTTSDDLAYVIDVKTGQILNWVVPSKKDMDVFLENECTELE